MTDPLDDLLAKMPDPDASEAEIEAFMQKVMTTPGGAELIHSFAEKITAGGSLDTMLKEEEEEVERKALKSPARFIFRIELLDTKPLFQLPANRTGIDLIDPGITGFLEEFGFLLKGKPRCSIEEGIEFRS
ncbi:hypothetical protein N9195_03295, partial [bacterium]|nr:hypothetical protein [bacterium]